MLAYGEISKEYSNAVADISHGTRFYSVIVIAKGYEEMFWLGNIIPTKANIKQNPDILEVKISDNSERIYIHVSDAYIKKYKDWLNTLQHITKDTKSNGTDLITQSMRKELLGLDW